MIPNAKFALPLMLLAQGYTMTITHKSGRTTEIETENISSINFSKNLPEDPDNPVPEVPEMNFSIADLKATSVKATVYIAKDGDYGLGIIPLQSAYIDDTELKALLKDLPATQYHEVRLTAGMQNEITFENLNPATEYIIAFYPLSERDNIGRVFVRTRIDTSRACTGTLFAPGVSLNGGFVDVDKVGDISVYGWDGSDNPLCWACSAAGMTQWWLNDYKLKTGQDYEMARPISTLSKCYSTPVMDRINDALYPGEGGSAIECIKWFFAGYYNHPLYGTPSNADNFNTMGPDFKGSYPEWRGGFMGMSWYEACDFLITNPVADDGRLDWDNTYFYHWNYSMANKDKDERINTYSDLVIEALLQGVLNMSFGGNHDLSCWGADYSVDENGNVRISALYICENENNPANPRGAMERCPIEYKRYPRNQQYLPYMTTPVGGQQAVFLMSGLRGWNNLKK